jgi:hypothetical protein
MDRYRPSYSQTWQTRSLRGQRGGQFSFGSPAASAQF